MWPQPHRKQEAREVKPSWAIPLKCKAALLLSVFHFSASAYLRLNFRGVTPGRCGERRGRRDPGQPPRATCAAVDPLKRAELISERALSTRSTVPLKPMLMLNATLKMAIFAVELGKPRINATEGALIVTLCR